MRRMFLCATLLAMLAAIGCDDDDEIGGLLTGEVYFSTQTRTYENTVASLSTDLPAAGTYVELRTADGVEASGVVGTDGRFQLTDLPAGRFTLRVHGPGAVDTVKTTIDIPGGAESVLEEPLRLTPHQALQVFPTEARGIVGIEFELDEPQDVALFAYRFGALADTVFSARLAAGRHRYRWTLTTPEGTLLPEGIYVVELEAPGSIRSGIFVQTPPPDLCAAEILQHWSQEEWALALAEGRVAVPGMNYPAGSTPDDVLHHVTREENESLWLANLLYNDTFAWGWREFWDREWNAEQGHDIDVYDPATDPPFATQNPYLTPLRQQAIDGCGATP